MRWLQNIRPWKLQTCASCGLVHRLEDMDIAYGRPDLYFQLDEHVRTEHWREWPDFAQLQQERFFIRCLAYVPIIRRRRLFAYGIWVEVDREKYDRYIDLFEDERQGREPPFSGHIANHLPEYVPTTLGLPVLVKLSDPSTRPAVSVLDAGHPLAEEQKHGITFDRLIEIRHSL